MTLRQDHEHRARGARRQRGESLDQQQPRDEVITKRVRQPGPRVSKVTRQPTRRAGAELAGMRWNAQASDHRRGEHERRGVKREGRSCADHRNAKA